MLKCLLIAVAISLAYLEPADLDVRLHSIVNGSNGDTSWVTPEIRTKVIGRLKALLETNTDFGSQLSIYQALLSLNDSETASSLVAKYHAGSSLAVTALQSSAKESAIEFIAPDLLLQDTPTRGDDVIIASVRDRSTEILAGILKRSSVGNAVTKKWAEMLYEKRFARIDEVHAELLQWWLHNKDYVLSGRFKEAAWFPPSAK